jgi:O-antigen ligase
MVLFAFTFPISIAGAHVLLAVMTLLWLIEGNFKEKIALLRKEKIVLVFLAIGLLTLLSILFSHSYENSFLTRNNTTLTRIVLSHFLVVPLLLIIVVTSIQKDFMKWIISAFLSSIFFSEVVSYLIAFEFIPIEAFKNLNLLYRLASPDNPTPFMHHTSYSIFLSVAILLLLDTLLKSKQRYFQLFVAIFLLSATINLFINGGRTGQLAFLFGVTLYMVVRYKSNVKIFITTVFILGSTVLIAYQTSSVFHDRVNAAFDDIKKTISGKEYNTSWGLRYVTNTIVIDYLFSTPKRFIMGAGVGDAKQEFQTYAAEHYPQNMAHPITSLSHLHNQFLQYWFDGTVLSFLLFLYYFFLMFSLAVKRAMKPLLYATTFVIMFASMTDILFFRHQSFMLFMLLTAFFILSTKNSKEHKRHH